MNIPPAKIDALSLLAGFMDVLVVCDMTRDFMADHDTYNDIYIGRRNFPKKFSQPFFKIGGSNESVGHNECVGSNECVRV